MMSLMTRRWRRRWRGELLVLLCLLVGMLYLKICHSSRKSPTPIMGGFPALAPHSSHLNAQPPCPIRRMERELDEQRGEMLAQLEALKNSRMGKQ
jgi:hypothetical protein